MLPTITEYKIKNEEIFSKHISMIYVIADDGV